MDNNVLVKGKITKEFTYDHSLKDEKYYIAYVTIKRKSGTEDTIPLIASEKVINNGMNYLGCDVTAEGKIRSFSCIEDGKHHLRLYVLVEQLECSRIIEEDNDIELEGYICKEPIYRTTPKGRELSDILLAIPRYYGKSDYVPCICWGNNARIASMLEVGTKVDVKGRFQSREYCKVVDGIKSMKIAYEISVNQIAI